MKAPPPRADQRHHAGAANQTQQNRDPRAEDVRRFQERLHPGDSKHRDEPERQLPSDRSEPRARPGSGQENKGETMEKHKQKPTEGARVSNPGEQMLVFFQMRDSSGTQTASPAPQAMALGELTQHLAERVLVSAPRLDDSPQVQIHLKEGVLPRTEIVLERKAGGLEVRFQTGDATALQTLHRHVEGLQQVLETRLGNQGSVRVVVESSSADQDMPGEGRSRNRYHYDDDEQ